MNYRTINNKGFGLLEVLVSISVVIVGILPMINLFNSVLARERDTENKLKAIYFAQEGIEIVRQVRDTNWRQGGNWDDDIPLGSGKMAVLVDCDDFEAGFEMIDSGSADSENFYPNKNPQKGYAQCENAPNASRPPIGFSRLIKIEKIDHAGLANNDYMKITSAVKLNGADLYSLISYLNKWQ